MWVTNALLAALLIAQSYIIPGRPRVAGCNAMVEDDWDNLTGWTQSTDGAWSADSTNDELDWSFNTVQGSWIINDTATTSKDNCIAMCFNSYDTDATSSFVPLVRAPTGGPSNPSYGPFYFYDSANNWYIGNWTVQTNNFAWVVDYCGPVQSGLYVDADDCVAVCVNGTGNDTVWEGWHWNEDGALPGNCRTDWPTSSSGSRTYNSCTYDCGTAENCVDNDNRRAGIGLTGITGKSLSIDTIVISDYVGGATVCGTDYTSHGDLIGLWYMEESGSNDRTDEINSQDLSVTGTIGLDTTNYKQGSGAADQATDGATGNYLSEAYASLSSDFPGRKSTSFTVMFWLRLGSNNNVRAITGMTASADWTIGLDWGDLDFTIWQSDWGSFTDSQAAVTAGTWQFVVATYDQAADTVQVWVNNSSDGSTATDDDTLRTGTSDFYVYNNNGSGAAIAGEIDAFSVWDIAVSSTIRSDIYANGYDGCGWDN